MSIRDKLLEAIEFDTDGLNESILLDILFESLKKLKNKVKELECENTAERECLHRNRDVLREEMKRIRTDPLASVYGEYYFVCDNHKYQIRIQGPKITMFGRERQIDYAAQQISVEEWNRA